MGVGGGRQQQREYRWEECVPGWGEGLDQFFKLYDREMVDGVPVVLLYFLFTCVYIYLFSSNFSRTWAIKRSNDWKESWMFLLLLPHRHLLLPEGAFPFLRQWRLWTAVMAVLSFFVCNKVTIFTLFHQPRKLMSSWFMKSKYKTISFNEN